MDRNQPHHVLWVSIGGVLIAVVVVAMIATLQPMHPSVALVVALAVVGCLGLYPLLAPFLGLRLPQTRTEPFWRDVRIRSPIVRVLPHRPVSPVAVVPPPRLTEAPNAAPERVFTHLDIAFLIDLASTPSVTSAQVDLLLAPYIGLWKRVEGRVTDVQVIGAPGALLNYTSVSFEESETGQRVSANFDGSPSDASRLPKGATVQIYGQIWHVSAYSVGLTHCEFETS
jgi:hypothetical protein